MEIKDLGTFLLLDAIEAWQGDPNLHPLTCGSDNCDHVSLVGKVKTINDVLNISSQKGATIFLKCPECDYTQDFVPDCVYNWYIGTHLNHKILLGQVVEVKFDEDCGADAIFFGADYKFPEGCEFLSPSLKVEGDKEIVL